MTTKRARYILALSALAVAWGAYAEDLNPAAGEGMVDSTDVEDGALSITDLSAYGAAEGDVIKRTATGWETVPDGGSAAAPTRAWVWEQVSADTISFHWVLQPAGPGHGDTYGPIDLPTGDAGVWDGSGFDATGNSSVGLNFSRPAFHDAVTGSYVSGFSTRDTLKLKVFYTCVGTGTGDAYFRTLVRFTNSDAGSAPMYVGSYNPLDSSEWTAADTVTVAADGVGERFRSFTSTLTIASPDTLDDVMLVGIERLGGDAADTFAADIFLSYIEGWLYE